MAFICQVSLAQVSDANLIAYYSFNNTLTNGGPGGSTYNLSHFGSGTNPAYLASGGITGGSINNSGCFEFNTTITFQNSEFFNLLESNPNQSFSVSYWAYNNQAQSTSSIRTHFEMFGSMFARGGLAWGISTQNGNFSLTSAANVSHTIGVWNHIALVYDASALRLRMYVNGFAYNEVATPANTIFKYNNKFVIGGGTDGSGKTTHQDYHWYRQHPNGYWSHKRGSTQVIDTDAAGNKIKNPGAADRNYRNVNYTVDCGVLCAKT